MSFFTSRHLQTCILLQTLLHVLVVNECVARYHVHQAMSVQRTAFVVTVLSIVSLGMIVFFFSFSCLLTHSGFEAITFFLT